MIEKHQLDEQGRPAGGKTTSLGLTVQWQDGPVPFGSGANGAQIEDVLNAALGRLEWLNSGEFRCRENSLAITHIEEALHWLHARTAKRVARGVEGTHIK